MNKVIVFVLLILSLDGPVMADAPMRMGTTFSRQQCIYLGVDWQNAYRAILSLDWDIIRLGAYWNEIEASEGLYDFTMLDWQIDLAKQKGVPVVLTVGMKAPRWPEYFIPAWLFKMTTLRYSQDISDDPVLKKYTLRFIAKIMEHYGNEPAIAYIQVENEALNKFGGKNWQLSRPFLAEEVKLVKSMDALKRPVILTTATYPNKFLRFLANMFTKGNWLRDNLELCDILGINVYPIIGQKMFGINHYVKTHPLHRSQWFDSLLKAAQKQRADVWVMELQAEPWEAGELVYTKKHQPASVSPEAVETYFNELKAVGFKTVFLWGAEFWYYQKYVNHNEDWWTLAKKLIEDSR